MLLNHALLDTVARGRWRAKVAAYAALLLLSAAACSEEEAPATDNSAATDAISVPDSSDDTPNSDTMGNTSDASTESDVADPNEDIDGQDTDGQDTGVPPALPKWTVLVYMAADNNLEASAVADLEEMIAGGADDQVNIIAQVDRADGFFELGVGPVPEWEGVKRFEIRGGAITELDDLGELNTGDPASLQDFLTWGMATWPAERTAVIFWNHGSAWQGWGSDDSSDHDMLRPPEIAAAIKASLEAAEMERFDFIGFDACLMATLEAARLLAPHTDRMLASEEFEPAHGWDYSDWIAHLRDNPDIDVDALGARIIEGYYEQARDNKKHRRVTLGLLDLTKIDGVVQAVTTLATTMDQELVTARTAIAATLGTVQQFGYHSDPHLSFHMIDLADFAVLLAEEEATFATARDELLSAIDELVLEFKTGADREGAQGLSIYFPLLLEYYLGEYEEISDADFWSSPLGNYLALAADPPSDAPTFADNSSNAKARSWESSAPIVPDYCTEEGVAVSASVAPTPATEKVANAYMLTGFTSDSGQPIILNRARVELGDDGTVEGVWDARVLSVSQGATKILLFSETDGDKEGRFRALTVPMQYSDPHECPCELSGQPGFSDHDDDGMPDCADGDVDSDGVPDKVLDGAPVDNCPWIPNPGQEDEDDNGVGDACEAASGAPELACDPPASGRFGELRAAVWHVTMDRLLEGVAESIIYVASGSGVSELTPVPGGVAWQQIPVLAEDGAMQWSPGTPLPLNLHQPMVLRLDALDAVADVNGAGGPSTSPDGQKIPILERFGVQDIYLQLEIRDFAQRSDAVVTQPPVETIEECPAPAYDPCPEQIADCDGNCINPDLLLPNGTCDDGQAGKPNLNCQVRGFDSGECVTPSCPAGWILDCDGQCSTPADWLGNGVCNPLLACAAFDMDQGDCPCGDACSGHGTCEADACVCADGWTGPFCSVPPTCGDAACALPETCVSCPGDCGACPDPCGDGTCSAAAGENCNTCEADCGACACGDGVCAVETESCTSCPEDCGGCPVCGDFVCQKWSPASPFGFEQGEQCGTCPEDCGGCGGDCCNPLVDSCGDAAVAACVCEQSPGCCATSWSQECVDLAKSACALECPLCTATAGGDVDDDGICGGADNCAFVANADQADLDSDGVGDACDPDWDGDGVGNENDNCALVANADQADCDTDDIGDACDDPLTDDSCDGVDDDCDGNTDEDVVLGPCENANMFGLCTGTQTCVEGVLGCDAPEPLVDVCNGLDDNCNGATDEGSADTDTDGVADCVDPDDDGDGIDDENDNCPTKSNPAQGDADGDDVGDACDFGDFDNDGTVDADDNCPGVSNAEQADSDSDGLGDACDACAANNGGCDTNATCADDGEGVTCACNTGWEGPGTTCTDIDECANNNGGCDPNATCSNQEWAAPAGEVDQCDVLGWDKDGGSPDVCAAFNGSCNGFRTFAQAESDCAAAGGRLCTSAELLAGEFSTTESCADWQYWTSTPCDGGGYETVLPVSSEVFTCNSGGTANVACCADSPTKVGRTCECNSGYTGDGLTCMPQ